MENEAYVEKAPSDTIFPLYVLVHFEPKIAHEAFEAKKNHGSGLGQGRAPFLVKAWAAAQARAREKVKGQMRVQAGRARVQVSDKRYYPPTHLQKYGIPL